MKDMKNRLYKVRGAFVKLKKMWNSKSISKRTKLRLFKTQVVSVLLYGCETGKTNNGDDKRLMCFITSV